MTKRSKGWSRNLSRTSSVPKSPEVVYNLGPSSLTHNLSNMMMMQPLLKLLDRRVPILKIKVTCDTSERTTYQSDRPFPHIREIYWVPCVSFVEFNLVKVNISGCGKRIVTIAHKDQLLLLWNVSYTRWWADAFTGVVHIVRTWSFYQNLGGLLTVDGAESIIVTMLGYQGLSMLWTVMPHLLHHKVHSWVIPASFST